MTESNSLLLTPLTAGQQHIIELLASIYREQRSWPPWQFVEQTLDNEAIDDASGLLANFPRVGNEHLVYGLSYGLTWTQGTPGVNLQPNDPVGLTFAGLYRAGATEYVDVFLLVLSMACKKLRNFVPNPQQAVTLELTSAEVYEAMGDNQKALLAPQELYALLEHEPAMWSGGRGMTVEGEWRWEITRPIRRYEDVRTIDDYVREITALTKEYAQPVAETVPFVDSGDFDTPIRSVYGYGAEAAQLMHKQLQPEVPLLGTGIDGELWEYVRPLANECRWEQVAREAAAFVETRARDWTGSKKDALDLMSDILKPDKSGGPPTRDVAVESTANEGWHLFARGFFMAVRNPVMHNSVGVEEQFQYGLGALGAASLLIRRIRTVMEDRTPIPNHGDSDSQQSVQ